MAAPRYILEGFCSTCEGKNNQRHVEVFRLNGAIKGGRRELRGERVSTGRLKSQDTHWGSREGAEWSKRIKRVHVQKARLL